MNKVILSGNLTTKPELKTTQSGISNTTFTLAVQRGYKTEEGTYAVDFINCVAWRGQADYITKYADKGTKCIVCGSIQTHQYSDKEGNTRVAIDIVCESIETIKTAPAEKKPTGLVEDENVSEGDLPF